MTRRHCEHNYKFENPWSVNHCGPVAVAHATGTGQAGALQIAEHARQHGALTPKGSALHMRTVTGLNHYWLNPLGWQVAQAQVLGGGFPVSVTYTFGPRAYGTLKRPGMTVGTMLGRREWQRGRWLVFVSHHVFALVDGVAWGRINTGARVQRMTKVEPIPA